MAKLDTLIVEVNAELTPVSGKGYIVFHDAYQYFEYRFGVSAVGSITVSPEVMPGAERIRTIQEKVKSLDATCVFQSHSLNLNWLILLFRDSCAVWCS